MARVKVVVMVKERPIEFEVDGQDLATNMRIHNGAARYKGDRPGQLVDLTKTPSDPISHDKAATLLTIIEEYRKK